MLLGSTAVLSGGKVTVKLAGSIGVGTHKVRVAYLVTTGTPSGADLTLKVVAAASRTKLTAAASRIKAGKNARLTVQVTTASGVVPAGTVRIVAVRSTTEIVRTVRLDSRGKAALDLGPLTKGTYKITVRTPVRRP